MFCTLYIQVNLRATAGCIGCTAFSAIRASSGVLPPLQWRNAVPELPSTAGARAVSEEAGASRAKTFSPWLCDSRASPKAEAGERHGYLGIACETGSLWKKTSGDDSQGCPDVLCLSSTV